MTSTSILKAILAGAAALLLASCAHVGQGTAAEARPAGSLVIVGGGLQRLNAPVYGRINELAALSSKPRTADGKVLIGILPTASGAPAEVAREYVEDFERHGGHVQAVVIPIRSDTPELAHDPETVAMIARCHGLFFTGGDQSRITAVFRPDGVDTPAYEAAAGVLAAGGVISGSSAGAAMMSDPMIRWGNSREALLAGEIEGEDRGVAVGQGMGFFPYGMTGQHHLTRGRLGRLIVAMERTGQWLGVGIDDNKAVEVDLATHEIRAIGSAAAVVVDLSRATRDGVGRSGIGLSLIGTGDVLHGLTGEITPAPGKTPVPAYTTGYETYRPADPWARGAFPDMIKRLATNPAAEYPARDEGFLRLALAQGPDTRFYAPPAGDGFDITAIGLVLSIEPGPEAEAEIQRLGDGAPD